jgi:hypothetical protein
LTASQIAIELKVSGQEPNARATVCISGIVAEQLCLARRWMNQAEHDPERGRFARAVGTQISEDLARLDRKADIPQRLHFAKVLAQPFDLQYSRCGHDCKAGKGAFFRAAL